MDIRKRIPDFAGMRAGDKVLDVCCGTGAQVLEYGRRDIFAIGVDINPSMLRVATRNRIKKQALNVSFQLADATSLPFLDGYFDYVTVSLGLHDKEKSIRYQIISEMKRIIKPNGSFILVDYQVPLPKNAWAVFVRAIEFLAGGSHYQGFKDYLISGGIDDILKNHSLQEKSRINLKSGLLVTTKAMNI